MPRLSASGMLGKAMLLFAVQVRGTWSCAMVSLSTSFPPRTVQRRAHVRQNLCRLCAITIMPAFVSLRLEEALRSGVEGRGPARTDGTGGGRAGEIGRREHIDNLLTPRTPAPPCA